MLSTLKKILNKTCLFFGIIILNLFYSCGIIKDTPKYSFANGSYRSKIFDKKTSKVYIENSDDSIFVYKINSNNVLDTLFVKLVYPQKKSESKILSNNFSQASFDIDFLTIPFKYRQKTVYLPQQFNTNLNGVIYLGYRNDIYNISYKKTPLNTFVRKTTHYGISYGLFTGLGGTTMNPWVTNNQISSEYDGVVWSKGLGAIIGVDNFSIGLAIGVDNILDQNKSYWIYQNKPWFGLAFGLNLN